jgi:hypothetical protein
MDVKIDSKEIDDFLATVKKNTNSLQPSKIIQPQELKKDDLGALVEAMRVAKKEQNPEKIKLIQEEINKIAGQNSRDAAENAYIENEINSHIKGIFGV